MKRHTLLRPRTLVSLALAAAIGATMAVLPALAAPSEAKLEVNENCVEANWPCWAVQSSGASPAPASKITIASGGEVAFTDKASTAAAVVWMGAAPACTGVPTSAVSGWEGRCKFEQPGTYRFESSTLWPEYTIYEIVVEGATTGTTPTTTTTTTTTATTSAPATPSEPSHGSPLQGGSRALKLASSQVGSTVRGHVTVSQAGSGGRLEVGLFATEASLAKAGQHPAQVRVGQLVRSSLKAGEVPFSVPLNAKGKATLRRHRHLTLTVKISLTPLRGAAVTITRVVVLHA